MNGVDVRENQERFETRLAPGYAGVQVRAATGNGDAFDRRTERLQIRRNRFRERGDLCGGKARCLEFDVSPGALQHALQRGGLRQAKHLLDAHSVRPSAARR
jgi:hypothetical protein